MLTRICRFLSTFKLISFQLLNIMQNMTANINFCVIYNIDIEILLLWLKQKTLVFKERLVLKLSNKAAKTAENDPADLVLSAVKNLLGSEESGNTEGELSSQESLLDNLAKSLNSQERTSDPVNKKLAEVANACLKKLGDDQYKETTGKYFRPENCKKVFVVLKVNEEIWGKLSRNAKSRDVKFSRLQGRLCGIEYLRITTQSIG